MELIRTLAAFILALGLLIVIHELGHYWVARVCGVKVLRFSVGFGKPILSRRRGADGTEWAIGAFPLGGYVKMLDEREEPVEARELHRAFNRQSVGKRIAIVLAGPVANFLLAIALYWLLFMVGIPGAKPIIAAPAAKSVAQLAGFTEGERIKRIDAVPVTTWQDVSWALMEHAIEKRTVKLETLDAGGQPRERELDLSVLSAQDLDGEFLSKLGLRQARVAPVIGRILEGSAAQRAGLRGGDEVMALNGEPIDAWEEFVQAVRVHPGKPLTITVKRGAQTLSLEATPSVSVDRKAAFGTLGAAVDESALSALFTTVRYGPIGSAGRAIKKTWDTSVFSLKMLGKIVTGSVSWKNLSGPITIAHYAGKTAELGWLPYVNFVALISISLGVLNLLPIPLLDGGHLMYYIVELIKGGPVPERIMEIGQQIGMAILLVLMLFAFYNDINRLITG